METPIVQALLICQSIITEEGTKYRSLINVMSEFRATEFPTERRPWIFLSMSNGNGKLNFTLKWSEVDSEKVIFSISREVTFEHPNIVKEVLLNAKIVFERPAIYSLTLECEGEILAERRIAVRQQTPRPAA